MRQFLAAAAIAALGGAVDPTATLSLSSGASMHAAPAAFGASIPSEGDAWKLTLRGAGAAKNSLATRRPPSRRRRGRGAAVCAGRRARAGSSGSTRPERASPETNPDNDTPHPQAVPGRPPRRLRPGRRAVARGEHEEGRRRGPRGAVAQLHVLAARGRRRQGGSQGADRLQHRRGHLPQPEQGGQEVRTRAESDSVATPRPRRE